MLKAVVGNDIEKVKAKFKYRPVKRFVFIGVEKLLLNGSGTFDDTDGNILEALMEVIDNPLFDRTPFLPKLVFRDSVSQTLE